MKKTAFLMQNSKGEFWTGYCFSDNLTDAMLYEIQDEVKHDIEMQCFDDCRTLEIEITTKKVSKDERLEW